MPHSPDVTKNYFRFRQFSPTKCAKGSFRLSKISGYGIPSGTKLTYCCPKGHFNSKTKRCEAGMKAQSVLVPRRAGLSKAKSVARKFSSGM